MKNRVLGEASSKEGSGFESHPRTNEELPQLSNLVKVEIWILQRGNRESTIEQFVFVEVCLFFSECAMAKRA